MTLGRRVTMKMAANVVAVGSMLLSPCPLCAHPPPAGSMVSRPVQASMALPLLVARFT